MRTGKSMSVSPANRRQLQALNKDRNAAQKHVWRAEIVLFTADGVGTNQIMRRTGKSKTCVWGRGRYARRRPDARRPTRRDDPLDRALMAKASGLSVSSVQRIWRAHGLQPHRIRQFKLSNDPQFVDKLRDVVGLYVDPPAHAIVLSVDEKSQIQALDRTQPGLPLKKGRLGTMTHDYKRHGPTTLFAALNVLDGTVISRNMQRHRHQELIRFLNTIEAEVPVGKIIHVILDNYAAHKHPNVRAWLVATPRFVFHFTPTSCSWLN